MQKGDFIRINYTGRIKETGEIFDKGEKIPIVVGEGFVIKGLDEIIQKMNVGESKTEEIPPEKAFGKRLPELVKIIHLSEFRKHNTNPYPGMIIKADNLYGRVLSVSSGRVKIDFNHPLAGKILEYDIEIVEKIEKSEEKVNALVEFFSGEKNPEVKISEKTVKIKLKNKLSEVQKNRISESVKKYLKVEKVLFIEEF